MLTVPFVFLFAIDWVIRISSRQRRNGTQLSLWSQQDDLDFANDLSLLSHNQQQMQEKTSTMAKISARLGLNIHEAKSNVMKVDATSTLPIALKGEAIEEMDSFAYLSSIVDMQGKTDTNMKTRPGSFYAPQEYMGVNSLASQHQD